MFLIISPGLSRLMFQIEEIIYVQTSYEFLTFFKYLAFIFSFSQTICDFQNPEINLGNLLNKQLDNNAMLCFELRTVNIFSNLILFILNRTDSKSREGLNKYRHISYML